LQREAYHTDADNAASGSARNSPLDVADASAWPWETDSHGCPFPFPFRGDSALSGAPDNHPSSSRQLAILSDPAASFLADVFVARYRAQPTLLALIRSPQASRGDNSPDDQLNLPELPSRSAECRVVESARIAHRNVLDARALSDRDRIACRDEAFFSSTVESSKHV